MTDLAALDAELNQMILEGKGLEAFEKFYADNCVMEEPTGDPARVGKDACRKSEEAFYGNIEHFHGAKLLGATVGDGITFSEWLFDFQLKGQPRFQMQQVARRRWKDGKIVHERFYYHRHG